MERRDLNPPTVYSLPSHFTQAVSVPVTNARLLFISAQLALDPQGQLVGAGDMTRQAEQVFDNLKALLAAEGATLDDVTKLTIYVTDISQRAKVGAVRSRYLTGRKPANTIVEVRRLASDDWLIAIDAIAVKHES
ncbi:RidA family protein [Pyxidicoccus trucidator]|uniref:RidA family protein n=1 Tax=Pyxidicoccus trucidator TaxID=2709662 RepID=UPI0013D909B4|nr:RidA family protein [Pyxidicoccus trucidator]